MEENTKHDDNNHENNTTPTILSHDSLGEAIGRFWKTQEPLDGDSAEVGGAVFN